MTLRRHGWLKSWVVAAVLLCVTGTAWGQAFFYPQRGQNPQQQQADQGECHVWATQQTGFNPGAPPPPSVSTAPQGEVLRGAGRGAALGAVGGAISGNAGKGAAIGAGTGALFGTMRRHDRIQQEQSQQNQALAMQAQSASTYNRALSTCMSGRGYAAG
jgi:hypothetical protein